MSTTALQAEQHPQAGPASGLIAQEPQLSGVGAAAALAGHRILLSFAPNPFDHWDLFEAGYREWNQGSDALISGRRVPGMLDLFRAGFRSGTLGLLLIRLDKVSQLVKDERGQAQGSRGIHGKGGVGDPVYILETENEAVVYPEENFQLGTALVCDAITNPELDSPVALHGSLISPNTQMVNKPISDRSRKDTNQPAGDDSDEQVHDSLLSLASIGFDTLSVKDRWLCGHLLYLKPEHRGRGLCRAYFGAVHALSGKLGLKGFQFISTLERWRKGNFFDVELYTVQGNGVEVFRYWKEA